MYESLKHDNSGIFENVILPCFNIAHTHTHFIVCLVYVVKYTKVYVIGMHVKA